MSSDVPVTVWHRARFPGESHSSADGAWLVCAPRCAVRPDCDPHLDECDFRNRATLDAETAVVLFSSKRQCAEAARAGVARCLVRLAEAAARDFERVYPAGDDESREGVFMRLDSALARLDAWRLCRPMSKWKGPSPCRRKA